MLGQGIISSADQSLESANYKLGRNTTKEKNTQEGVSRGDDVEVVVT